MSNFRELIADAVRDLAERSVGAVFWLETTVVNENLKSATNLNLTGLASGGDLAIEEIVVRGKGLEGGGVTGGGLSGGGSFRIFATNVFGSSVIFATAISNLGTSRIMSMDLMRNIQASNILSSGLADMREISNQPTILEDGARLYMLNETADGAGTGSASVAIKFRKLNKASRVDLA